MLGHIVLWFLLGIVASVLLNMLHEHRVTISGTEALVSVLGALFGGLVMLIAAPGAPGWALLTALMGSVIALTGVWISREAKEQAR
jgi:hypothetical protein